MGGTLRSRVVSADDLKPADRVPELIRDWSEIVADTLRVELELADADAARVGALAVQAITNAYGGMQFYIPQDYARRLTKRDQAIYERSNSRNLEELAREHDLSVTAVRRIIARCHAYDLATRNGNLFPDAG